MIEAIRQALSAAGYLAIFLMPALLVLGAEAGVPWLAFGVVVTVFPLMRVIFGALPAQPPRWSEQLATGLDALPLCFPPVYGVCVLWALYRVATSGATAWGWLGFGLSLWMTSLFATCVAHELLHRRSPWQSKTGHALAGVLGYPVLGAEHLAHHARPGDSARAEVPRFDESVWHFSARRLRRIAVEFLGPRAAVWAGQGGQLSPRLRIALVSTLIGAAAFGVIGGVPGLALFVAVSAGVAFGIQLITYLQHWALDTDALGERVAFGRGWEEDCRFQAWITLNISVHDGHHLQARLPYYRLALAADSPRLPASYVLLMFLSLVPRAWFAVMRPALAHWLRSPTTPLSAGRSLTCFGIMAPRS
jgi:fatty acid desaturase